MKRLLKITALIECIAGLGLLAVPAIVVRLLLDSELLGAGIPVGRVAGTALLALGVACWLAQYDEQSCAARAVVSAMVIYNLGAVAVLGATGVQSPAVGIALWPAVLLHLGMAVWSVTSLMKKTTAISCASDPSFTLEEGE